MSRTIDDALAEAERELLRLYVRALEASRDADHSSELAGRGLRLSRAAALVRSARRLESASVSDHQREIVRAFLESVDR